MSVSPLAVIEIESRAVPARTLVRRSAKLTLEVTGLAPPVSLTNTVMSSDVSVDSAGRAEILTPIVLSLNCYKLVYYLVLDFCDR